MESLTQNKYLATNEQDVDFYEWLSQRVTFMYTYKSLLIYEWFRPSHDK